MYDIIVIGAGPAGCTAAKTLAEAGCHVLLIEKFKLPRYKSCSGQLIQKSIDLIQTYFSEDVPVSVLCTPAENRGMILTDDKGRSLRFEQRGLNVWRSSFDQWLADKAAQSGAEIRDCTAALSCLEQDGKITVTLKGKTLYQEQASYLINCEGVAGVLKRKILNRDAKYITTYQTFNQGRIDLDPHYFYAYLQPELSEYDAWFNVKDQQLVCGVAVKDIRKVQACYARFLTYLQEKHNLKIVRQIKTDLWLMPYIRPGCAIDYGKGRIFFAGEIAGFLNPMGEGISAAIESGHSIALAIARHFDHIDMIYRDYKEGTNRLHSYMKRQWNLTAGMAETFAEMRE